MAGSAVPTMMLLVVLSGFLIARYTFQIPIPIERAIIFPMALVPNLFGLWNIFYLWLRPRRHLPIGFHGAILPFIHGADRIPRWPLAQDFWPQPRPGWCGSMKS